MIDTHVAETEKHLAFNFDITDIHAILTNNNDLETELEKYKNENCEIKDEKRKIEQENIAYQKSEQIQENRIHDLMEELEDSKEEQYEIKNNKKTKRKREK